MKASVLTAQLNRFLRGLGLDEMGYHVKSEQSGGLTFPTVSLIGVDVSVTRQVFDELDRLKAVGGVCGFDLLVDHKYIKTRP